MLKLVTFESLILLIHDVFEETVKTGAAFYVCKTLFIPKILNFNLYKFRVSMT